jgi:methyl-accepting chemotaxis protein
MFIISVAVTTYSLVVEKQLAIAFARQELAGSKFLAALRPVYLAVLANKPFNPSALESDVSAHNALDTLATTRAEPAATLQVGAIVEALSDSLTHVPPTSQVHQTANAVDALAKMQQLAARAGDSSNLTLDTDLDTYYVQNIIVDQLPKLLGRLGELQLVPAQASGSAISPGENKVRFLVLDGLVKSTTDEIKNNLTAA